MTSSKCKIHPQGLTLQKFTGFIKDLEMIVFLNCESTHRMRPLLSSGLNWKGRIKLIRIHKKIYRPDIAADNMSDKRIM